MEKDCGIWTQTGIETPASSLGENHVYVSACIYLHIYIHVFVCFYIVKLYLEDLRLLTLEASEHRSHQPINKPLPSHCYVISLSHTPSYPMHILLLTLKSITNVTIFPLYPKSKTSTNHHYSLPLFLHHLTLSPGGPLFSLFSKQQTEWSFKTGIQGRTHDFFDKNPSIFSHSLKVNLKSFSRTTQSYTVSLLTSLI